MAPLFTSSNHKLKLGWAQRSLTPPPSFVYIQQPQQGFKIITIFKITVLAAILAKFKMVPLFTSSNRSKLKLG